MASGFITLRNGSDWSARWSGYDLVLEMIMDELEMEGDEGEVKTWLKTLIPEDKDIESGYCFIRRSNGESVLRILDTRFMKEKYLQIFWDSLKRVCDKETNSVRSFLTKELFNCYLSSLKDTYVEPPPFNPDEEELSDRQIGPGWN